MNDKYVCDCNIVHKEIVDNAKTKMPDDNDVYDLSDFFKMLADSTRLKILCALAEAEICVCDLASLLNMTQSAISHQLRLLRASRLVKYRRDGKISYYSLNDEHVETIISMGMVHIKEKN